MAYIEMEGFNPLPDAPIFRQHKAKRGKQMKQPWTDESDFSKDFALIRRLAFGKDEKRLAMDIRRSVNLEAALGEAKAEDRAALLANSLDTDARLEKTYTPPTLEAARRAKKAQAEGARIRNALTENSVRRTSSDGKE